MFHGYPFDLANQETFVDRDQKVAVDSGEQSGNPVDQSSGIGCLNVKHYFDVIRRYEINRSYPAKRQLARKEVGS